MRRGLVRDEHILARDGPGPRAEFFNLLDERRADHIGQNALDDRNGGGIGDAQAVDEAGAEIFLPHLRRDRLASAVDDDRIDSHCLKENHIAQDALHQDRIFHGRAAVLDDHGMPAEPLEVGQRLDQRVGLGILAHIIRLN